MEEQFPGNSNKQHVQPEPQAQQQVTQVVTGEVIQRKRPLHKKFMETFFGGDLKTVSNVVMWQVAVPYAKDMFMEIMTQGMERTLWKDGARPGPRGISRPGYHPANSTAYGSASYMPYNKVDPRGGGIPDPRNNIGRQARESHNFGEFLIPTKAEADAILIQMYELLEKYEVVTLSAFYRMCNITPTFADEKYGWTDLTGSRSHRARGGYILELPRPTPLD